MTHRPIAPNAADVEVATATDPIETVVDVIPFVIPAAGALVIFLLAFIEGSSRLLGWYDFAIKRDRHVVWNMAWSQKQDVQDVRQARENGKANESFSIQTRTQ